MSKRTHILALLFLAPLLSATALAQEGELTQRDRTAALYSTQFTFDAERVPVIRIALMEGQSEVRLASPGRLTILPDGEGGPEVVAEGGLTWSARVEGGKPASVRHWVVLERLPARALSEIRAAKQRWAEKGLAAATVEVGSVFSFFGQVMDNRTVFVVEEKAYDDGDAARAAAEACSQRWSRECFVHAKLVEPPRGTVVLTNDRGTMTVRSPDVVWLAPVDTKQTIKVFKVEYGKGFSWHGFQDRSYRGALYLAVDSKGKLAVVNAAPAETLLRGIVPAEIFPSAAMDALRAQAVVARGELLAKIGTRHLADPYLICADVHCQAYAGVEKEHARTDQAVIETRGEMLFDEGGLVDSVFSANCGGHTESNEVVWPSPPVKALRGVADAPQRPAWLPEGPMTEETVREFLTKPSDAYCGRATLGSKDSFRWKVEHPAAKVTELVNKLHGVGDVLGLTVKQRGLSGRVMALEVRGAKGTVTVERELPIRQLLGGLKSGLFVVDTDVDGAGRATRFRFVGGGFGHGVGLCQVGAIGMAEAGKRYVDILAHYYVKSGIKKVY